ncbi:50S ribosomal protein L6 [Rubrobacter xylanophilus DSM 9941]|uniref:Large ribosomal subunit protein uL6 n=1 Tax=Rubrobacter xylanophilus TaxID=49319 RepID=A0A510HHY4_9ACTN|nr:50S ribosomal protein L6 [Rubrobacter xylanophilus]QYJ15300.1 50S ribosomal protein L6 [Rubrobacter xylanophilus DSM 9941]BBL79569.1 50S ribosomal protein L6 [Rubrobacter xylanophilus]
MSRIGRAPVEVPGGVSVEISARSVKVRGPKGELTVPVGRGVSVREEDGKLFVERSSDAPQHRAMHGLTRSLLNNAVVGVTEGFAKTLQISGVGYRAQLQGQNVVLQVGYSHPVTVEPREGIQLEVPNPTTIVVRGIDKQQVGQMAAEIRRVRPPEPYKGKGIRYEGEQIRRKVGKAG